MSVGTTEIYLIKAPLEKDYEHTIAFTSLSEQEQWFKSKSFAHITNLTYQRKDHKIRVPYNYDLIAHCNYVMYKNPDLTNKWYYAFITKMEYKNNNETDVFIETDVMQTWLFDYTVRRSFVEREHVDSDNVGEHTIPENLELGEYICNKHNKSPYTDEGIRYVLGATQPPSGVSAVRKYTNLLTSLWYAGFTNDEDGMKAIETRLSEFESEGKADAVQVLFTAPKRLVDGVEGTGTITITQKEKVDTLFINNPVPLTGDNADIELTTGKLDEYTPLNNKLLTYPYRYLLVSNNAGSNAIYHYEKFRNSGGKIIDPSFRINGVLCPGCSIRMIPLYYNGIASNEEEGINGGKFSILNWTSDVYTNWLTQNSVNIGVDVASGLLQVAGGVMVAAGTGGAGGIIGASTIASGVMQITGSMATVHQHSMLPAQSKGNINAGDVNTVRNVNDFHFYDMSIKMEYARIIDRYFTMFGYKVNLLTVPNKFHRENYWYTKCINVNLDGNIPQNDLQKIKDCYNRGITFWRNGDTIGDYNFSNAIVK